MSNVAGDAKPREVVEDTAVAVEDLPAYIAEFDGLMRNKYGLSCVYYAHAGAGELHTRPLFNLKTPGGVRMFRDIATDVAALVKRYRGSLSGEHGDGRLRGEFTRRMVGDECYEMMRRVKETFDSASIFNPGKIIDTPPMDACLRHSSEHPAPEYETVFNFEAARGMLRAVEKCTGVGECRKTHLMGGAMCPSFMATRNERDSPRARANILREALTHTPREKNAWDNAQVAAVMDNCLSCKACKSECPANVDITRLKAEWLQHYHDARGVPLRSRFVAGFGALMRLGSLAPSLYNLVARVSVFANIAKRVVGFAPGRSLPMLHKTTLAAWHRRHANQSAFSKCPYPNGRVFLFCDEFTNYNDARVGICVVELFNRLGYEVVIPRHAESGRAHFSKGLVRGGRKLAIRNVEMLKDVISAATPLVGIEPSALLGFRDEYPDLVPARLAEAARRLAENALLVEEFIAREVDAGRITEASFKQEAHTVMLHGHCHQKALSSLAPVVKILERLAGCNVQIIPSGCCGMAGAFGYEKEHYEMSQKIGELALFPAVRGAGEDVIIAASGTSCRHQIKDGTGRRAVHPVEILHGALR
jgi:Fe-S oxidoreductase